MKRINKFIIYSMIGLMALNFAVPIASAKTVPLSERNQNAQNRYEASKRQYQQEVSWWKSSRQDFLQAKKNYQLSKTIENRVIYEEQGRNFLETSINVLITRSETTKNWVLNKGSISETEQQEILAEIDADIVWLESKKINISTATYGEIKIKARDVLEYWRGNQIYAKKIVSRVMEARLTWMAEKYVDTSTEVAVRIDKLKAAGKDTTELEAWLLNYDSEVAIAQENRDKARASWQAITDDSSLAQADQLFRESNDFIKEANTHLISAHKILVDIVKEMRLLATEK